MKRQSLYNLIKAHFSNDEKLFLNSSREISRDIAIQGDKELAIELNKLIRSNTRVTLSGVNLNDLFLSKSQNKFLNILIRGFNSMQINKVFLYGNPGTGKTTFANKLSGDLNIDIENISLSTVIDSKLGESMKLLDKVFRKDNKKRIIFIDEIDSIASKRGFNNDIFEISRLLNHLLQLMDNLDNSKLLIVATNLPNQIDSAFVRRFDLTMDFNTYLKEDIMSIFELYVIKYQLSKYKEFYENIRKFIRFTFSFWTPGYIKRAIQVSTLWLEEDYSANNQLIEIFKLIGMGENREIIRENLIEKKVPARLIKYFINGGN